MRSWIMIMNSCLLAVITVACVPVPFEDQDVAYEHLEDGIYFLKVSAPAETDALFLKKQWNDQARRLCHGSFRDDARIFHRHNNMGRNRGAEYQQMRGNVFCQ